MITKELQLIPKPKRKKKNQSKEVLMRVSLKDGIIEDNFKKHMGFVYDENKYDEDGKRK